MQTQILYKRYSAGWHERILLGFIAIASIISGLIFGALILGLGVVAALGLGARVWWLRRQLHRSGPTVIDGEYVVLEEHRESKQERAGD